MMGLTRGRRGERKGGSGWGRGWWAGGRGRGWGGGGCGNKVDPRENEREDMDWGGGGRAGGSYGGRGVKMQPRKGYAFHAKVRGGHSTYP